jgi:hypothetical protein
MFEEHPVHHFQNLEAVLCVLFIESLQFLVLWRESTSGGSVNNLLKGAARPSKPRGRKTVSLDLYSSYQYSFCGLLPKRI